MDKNELLDKINEGWVRWQQPVSAVPAGRWEVAGVDGNLSVKDLIAHVTWYERDVVDLLESRRLDASEIWLLPQEERNSAIFNENKDRALADVLADAQQTHERLVAAVAALAEEDLSDPEHFATMPTDWVPWQIIAENSYQHYADHEQAVESWMNWGGGPEPQTKAEMAAVLDKLRTDWVSVLAGLTPQQMEQPGAMDNWPFRDIVAHLTGWRKRTVARLEAAASGAEPTPPEWPANLDDDEINNWLHETYSKRPLSEVLAESDEYLRRLEAALALISLEDMVTPGRFPWLNGYPLLVALQGTSGHYWEHAAGIRAWLATLRDA